MRPDQRATDTQRDSVRAELLSQVNAICDAWPIVLRQAKEMGRGYPSGGEGTGEPGSLTERVALSDSFDPATAANDWLAHLSEFRGHAKNLAGSLSRVLPLDPKTVERGRVNQVDVCALCGEPNPKVRRVDGVPYCATSCYFKVWRSGRQTG